MAAYVIAGGIKGVMLTDALQGTIMLVGMVALLGITYTKLGGFTAAHATLTHLTPQVPAALTAIGHQGWTSMPVFGWAAPGAPPAEAARYTLWWTMVSTIVMGVGIGVLAQPQLAVRYMTVKSVRELNRAVFIGGIFILAMTGVAFVVGALSNVYFFNSAEFKSISLVAAGKNVEEIIPLYIKKFMPFWMGDVFMITLLAAAMSTASSQFHAMGAAAGRDLYDNLAQTTGDTKSILTTRLGILLTFIASVSLAYILPMYIGGLYSRGITKAGAIWGSVSGFVASALWLVFVHHQEASALLICQKLFGKASLLEGKTSGFVFWQEVDALVIALPLSAIVTIVVSMITKKFEKEHLDSCFAEIR
ncbi:MAG: Sodium/pantothenate symporter [candidate division BRC1 bacterium ADurb.BinA364]|nr:MAG: Sodium/pantothenate symporter [candidate division BRC1 bacterium ADurb.BinA364]